MIFPQKKYVPLVFLLVLLLAMGGIVWYGIVPLRQSLQVKMRGIQEFYAGRENRDRQVNKLPELQGQYDTIIENEKTLDILLSEDAVVEFVKTVEKLAKEMNVGMTIASKDGGKIIEPKKPVAKSIPSKDANQDPVSETKSAAQKAVSILDDVPFDRYLYLSVTVDGRYEDIVAFLRKMETLPFGLDVIKIEMKQKDKEKDSQPMASSPSNPFAILGDMGDIVVQAAPQAAEKNSLEAVFDILVYVKKN